MSEPLFGGDVLFQQRLLKTARLYPGALDGLWGPLTDQATATFAVASEDIACPLRPFRCALGASDRLAPASRAESRADLPLPHPGLGT